MSSSIEAMCLALEALEANQPVNYCMNNNGEKFPMMQEDPFKFERNTKAITALRQAIAVAKQHKQAQKQDHFPDATKMVTQKQEPVAHVVVVGDMVSVTTGSNGLKGLLKLGDGAPLYTSPPQRPVAEPHKPLTDEQITSVWETRPYFNDFARAIEAAHGIMSVPDGKGEPT